MKQSLWGHALSLASKMDARTYASIMTRFTNSLAVNDPLQTLYQHMSGRQPAAVTVSSQRSALRFLLEHHFSGSTNKRVARRDQYKILTSPCLGTRNSLHN